jgi:hypothetical protein
MARPRHAICGAALLVTVCFIFLITQDKAAILNNKTVLKRIRKKMTKKKIPELKIERIDASGNMMFLSLIEYKHEDYLCVIDNIRQSEIDAYVLDYAEQCKIDVQLFFQVVTRWFYSRSDDHPLSVELSKHGLTHWGAPIYRTFDRSYVSRIVGHGFNFAAINKTKVKRRRVIPIPEGIEIVIKKKSQVEQLILP